MAPQSVLIQQLHKGRCEKKFSFRVARMWKSYNTKKARELMSQDLLLIDEQFQAIHCCIRSKFIPDFHGLFAEGSFYSVKNFTVDTKRPLFRVVQRDLFILLDASTFVEEIVKDLPNIPRHFFRPVPFDMLLAESDDKKNLCDIVGYLVGASEVGQRVCNFQPVSIQLIDLENASGNKIRLTLWGDDIIGVAQTMIENRQRVLLICAIIAKLESNGSLTISTSSATKFYSNTAITEIEEFVALLGPREGDREIENIPMYSSFITKEEYDRNKMQIRDINGLLLQNEIMKKPIYTYASVSTIEEVNGWKYNSCNDCNKKLQFQDGKPYCNKCKKDVMYPTIRYRVEAELHDGTDSLKCVLFDREIEKLIGIKASDLVNIVDEEGYAEPVPRQLRKIIGKCHVFQVLFNDESRGTMHENFTVKRVLFEYDIRDKENDKGGKNFEGDCAARKTATLFAVKTPYIQEKRKSLRIGSQNEETSTQTEDDGTEQSGKGQANYVTKKAKKGLEF